MTKILLRAGALSCALLASSALTAPAMAQSGALPRFNHVDANGVDLYTGDFFFSMVAGTIGTGEGALSLVRNWAGAAGWTDNWSGTLSTATIGGVVHVFVEFGTYADDFTYSGGVYTSSKADGATLTDLGGYFRYVARDGTRIDYLRQSAQGYPFAGDNCQGCAIPVSVQRPNGLTYTLNWDVAEICTLQDDGNCVENAGFVRFLGVANSANYAFALNYASDNPGQYQQPPSDWFRRTQVQFTNLDGAPASLPTVTYNRVSSTVLDVIDTGGQTWRLTNGSSGRLTGIRRPGAGSDTTAISYSGPSVVAVTREGVATYYSRFISGSGGSMTVTDANGGETIYDISLTKERITDVFDASEHGTSYAYDSSGRLTRITRSEGNYVQYTYDARGNVTQTLMTPKSGSGLPAMVTTASYSSTCANPVVCNLPNSTTDARGNETNYTYDATHGGVLTVTAPAPSSGAARPQTRYSYSAVAAVTGQPVTLTTEISACASGSADGTPSCVGTASESRTVIAYDSDNLRTTSVTARNGDNSLSAPSAYTYDAIGNMLTVDGPLAGSDDTTRFRYDAARRTIGVVGPDPDGVGSLKHRAVRTTYTNGLPTSVERGTVDSQSDGDWAAFAPLERVEQAYDANARPTVQRLISGSTTYALSQTSYDNLGRVRCTAQRMNPAEFASLPSDACTLDSEGSYGPDRISRVSYDPLSRPILVETGVGTAAAADEAATSYTAAGQVETVTDANGNRTTYVYDGHDRLSQTRMPDPATPGTSSTTDYEALTYETLPGGTRASPLVVSRRLRDNTSIGYSYDLLGRLTERNMPAIAWYNYSRAYTYDNFGRLATANGTGTNAFAYDALGRLISETGPFGTTTYQYDLAGRRTRLTYTDGFYVTYDRLLTGEVTAIRENGTGSGAGVLGTYAYDDRGRRTSLTRGNGTETSYIYDDVSRLSSLTQNLNGTSSDVTFGYSYNPASEIAANTRSNDAYSFTLANANVAGTFDGLNRITAIGGSGTDHDARGNVSWAPTAGSVTGIARSFSYTSDNALAVVGSGTTYKELLADSVERLLRYYDGSAYRFFLYDGEAMVAETNAAANAIVRRYVHGPGTDEPLVWYEGSDTATRRWFHADERGSVIAISDASGDVVSAVNRYEDEGAPQGTLTGRFGYTGQPWFAEIGLYHYRARAYDPALGGRFLQTDPIGYEGGMNLYAYVGNNPVNFTDPSGLQEEGQEVVVIGRPLPQNTPGSRLPARFFGGFGVLGVLGQQEPDFGKIGERNGTKQARPPRCSGPLVNRYYDIPPGFTESPYYPNHTFVVNSRGGLDMNPIYRQARIAAGAPAGRAGWGDLLGPNPGSVIVDLVAIAVASVTGGYFYPATVGSAVGRSAVVGGAAAQSVKNQANAEREQARSGRGCREG